MTPERIADLRRDTAFQLREAASMIDTGTPQSATDNHLASTLLNTLAEITVTLAELYAAVEAQRSVAFAMRSPEERGI